MIAVWLLSCLALASAAPQFHLTIHHGPPPQRSHSAESDEIFGGNVFDTRRFWQDLETEMHRFDQMLEEFYKRFPATASESRIQGNEYVIMETLTGFDEQDVKVKAREGVLMIQAVHKTEDGNQRSYLNLKTLPSYVNVNGSWTFENGVLKVTLPLKSRTEDVTPVTEEFSTSSPEVENRSREEMDTADNDNHENADVGLETNNDKENEIRTNIISKNQAPVEATTYAVDLKNEVEFVPVKY